MTDYFINAAGSLVMNGPTGILISLGIESVAGMTLALAYMYYNYISTAIIFFVAAMAGARSESRFLIILPLVTAMLFSFGWIHTPSQITFLVFLAIVFALGIFSYMNDVNHEKYGVTGPGSKIFNIVFYIILVQAVIGFAANVPFLYVGDSIAQPIPNACTVGYQCDSLGNIQLTESIGTIADSGGLMGSVTSIMSTFGMLAISLLKMVVTILGSVLLFSVVVNAIANGLIPGIASNAVWIAFIALMQVGIWIIYLLTIFTWYFKPQEGTL